MIVFENPGEADIFAMTTFGVSAKIGKSPIGEFGTGFKYAVAVLMRRGHAVTVRSGLTTYRFSTHRETSRGQDFDVVDVRVGEGPATSCGFTTELGKKWKLWMAYRELRCNATDEDGEIYFAANASCVTDQRRGLTQVLVEGDEIESVHSDAPLYFLDCAPDVRLPGVEVTRRPSRSVFYRGVSVMEFPKPAAMTYNFTRKLDLTEDRTLQHPFMVGYYLARELAGCEDRAIVETALTAVRGSVEADLDWSAALDVKPASAFLDSIAAIAAKKDKDRPVPPAAASILALARPSVWSPTFYSLADAGRAQRESFDKASKIAWVAMGLDYSDDVAVTDDPFPDDRKAAFHQGKMVVARSALTAEGVRDLAAELSREILRTTAMEPSSDELEEYLIKRAVDLAVGDRGV